MTQHLFNTAAQRGTLYNLQFNSDDDLAMYTATEPGWNPDRTEPDEWVRETGKPRKNSARLNLDEDEDTTGFWSFQGFNYEKAGGGSWEVPIPRRLKTTGSLYIDSAWEANNEERRFGLWYALGNDEGDWTWFEILEYRSSAVTGDEPSFFRFGSENGYEDAGAPTRIQVPNGFNGGWIDLTLFAEPRTNETDVEWKANGQPLFAETFDNPFGDTDHFMDSWIQVVNQGQDHDFHLDKFTAQIN